MKKLAFILVFGGMAVYFVIAQTFYGGRALIPALGPSNTFAVNLTNATSSIIREVSWPQMQRDMSTSVVSIASNALQTAIDGKQPLDSDLTRIAVDGAVSVSSNGVVLASGTNVNFIQGTNTNIRITNVNNRIDVYIASVPDGNDGGGAATGILPGVTNYGPYVLPAQKTVTGAIDLAGTNAWTINTNGNFEFSFSGTARHGQLLRVAFSNYNINTRIIGTNLAGVYDSYARSNRTTWEFESNAVTYVDFVYDTNFNNGGMWAIDKWAGPEYSLEAAGGVLLNTNGMTRIITASVNPTLSLNLVRITNGLMLTGPLTNQTDSYLDSTHVGTFDASGVATFGNDVSAKSLQLTNALTFVSTNMIPSGNLTNFRAYYDRPVHTYLMTNGFHLTGIVNTASADLIRGIVIIGRNYSGGALPVSCDSTFRRAGTNYVSVGNNQFFRMSALPDGTGGSNPTNSGIDIQVYDSP